MKSSKMRCVSIVSTANKENCQALIDLLIKKLELAKQLKQERKAA